LAPSSGANRLLAVKDFHHDPGDVVQVWDATPLAETSRPDPAR
jgi:hypothetical protein